MNSNLVLDRETEAASNPASISRLHHCFERQCDVTPHAEALICDGERLTYTELDARSNRLAHYLIALGIGPGDRVGLLLERSSWSYVTLLAILKAGAAFVPVDISCPLDRLAFIATDAELALLITTSSFAPRIAPLPCRVLAIDLLENALPALPSQRPDLPATGDSLAYLIYTSGTSGQPKGVAVNHSNICFFLNACAPVYGVQGADRVYQGMTLAFDFSIEEIWPTFIAGATLVAGPTGFGRMGDGLTRFLRDREVTILYAVPTLLATLEFPIPSLRMIVVGGEPCPPELVDRWAPRVGRMLNTYGPTEATVTATWTELSVGKRVTIGHPMPGYRVDILDSELRPVPYGEAGEICIGGRGVAQGYVGRAQLTAGKFVPDPLESGRRLYRSGDLGRLTADGEIEFLGRIDNQVKLRGFRIELDEIEAVLLADPSVESAIVSTVGSPPSDLAAYITVRNQTAPPADLRERLAQEMLGRLPVYMVPAWLEIVDRIPILASGKADRAHLPSPSSPRLALRDVAYVAPGTAAEQTIAAVWREIFGHPQISIAADFFLDLGGHSLFAAQAISRLRSEPAFSHVSIADLYAHPTIRGLAAQCGPVTPAPARPEPLLHSNVRVWTAGVVQLVLLYLLLAVFAIPGAWLIVRQQHSPLGLDPWDLAVPPLLLALSLILPVVLKWTLIGRYRPGPCPLWSWYYCRHWLVRKALDLSPIACLAGSPWIAVYARLLGARIGRNCQIATPHLHVPDLLGIGDNVSIGYDVELQPFVVESGRLKMAPIRIGSGAFIGSKSVLLAGADVGPGARVAEQSLVASNQHVPAGESWAGSPSQPCAADPIVDEIESLPAPGPIASSLWTGYLAGFAALELLNLLIALPGAAVLATVFRAHGLGAALLAAPVAGLAFILTACLAILSAKRLTLWRTRPGLYAANSRFGVGKWFVDQLMRTSLSVTNTLYATLYTLPWLRALGARIGARSEISTVSHINPDLLVLDAETFVADLASLGAAVFHRGYVALGPVRAGTRTFIGNAAAVRAHTALPANCLIGVASVPPIQPSAPGTSWLGSPAMFLPKRQLADGFAESVTYRPKPSWVAYRLAVEFWRVVLPPTFLYLLGIAIGTGARSLGAYSGMVAATLLLPAIGLLGAFAATLAVAALKWILVGRYRPRVEPLWSPFVRHTELVTGLYESVAVPALIGLATGTPWAAPLLRLFGASIGQRVWLDTTYLTEFDLISIGDDAAIGRATSLQTHLFEDRVMKMSTVSIGAGCEAGPRSIVLYDSAMKRRSSLDALSLVMKGESLPEATRWRGIPARRCK
jgi:non-ribosomal peptide synthetase-like protein